MAALRAAFIRQESKRLRVSVTEPCFYPSEVLFGSSQYILDRSGKHKLC